jgi:hypothetical protein
MLIYVELHTLDQLTIWIYYISQLKFLHGTARDMAILVMAVQPLGDGGTNFSPAPSSPISFFSASGAPLKLKEIVNCQVCSPTMIFSAYFKGLAPRALIKLWSISRITVVLYLRHMLIRHLCQIIVLPAGFTSTRLHPSFSSAIFQPDCGVAQYQC